MNCGCSIQGFILSDMVLCLVYLSHGSKNKSRMSLIDVLAFLPAHFNEPKEVRCQSYRPLKSHYVLTCEEVAWLGRRLLQRKAVPMTAEPPLRHDTFH